ncbi:hypothetical protein E2C01_020602 [Portunus trituberculatus]|uniref:Uncharacterized protein n=1 Tax=Portunus trituberculatus TaxID=210409 RepID=A0A5B7E3V6_PORTR|nr:hypothetical protein [Portunus trituberculatus]
MAWLGCPSHTWPTINKTFKFSTLQSLTTPAPHSAALIESKTQWSDGSCYWSWSTVSAGVSCGVVSLCMPHPPPTHLRTPGNSSPQLVG